MRSKQNTIFRRLTAFLPGPSRWLAHASRRMAGATLTPQEQLAEDQTPPFEDGIIDPDAQPPDDFDWDDVPEFRTAEEEKELQTAKAATANGAGNGHVTKVADVARGGKGKDPARVECAGVVPRTDGVTADPTPLEDDLEAGEIEQTGEERGAAARDAAECDIAEKGVMDKGGPTGNAVEGIVSQRKDGSGLKPSEYDGSHEVELFRHAKSNRHQSIEEEGRGCGTDAISHVNDDQLPSAHSIPTNGTSSRTEYCADYWKEKRKKKKKKSNFLYCDLCNIEVNGQIVMESHLRGQKHQNKLSEAALKPKNERLAAYNREVALTVDRSQGQKNHEPSDHAAKRPHQPRNTPSPPLDPDRTTPSVAISPARATSSSARTAASGKNPSPARTSPPKRSSPPLRIPSQKSSSAPKVVADPGSPSLSSNKPPTSCDPRMKSRAPAVDQDTAIEVKSRQTASHPVVDPDASVTNASPPVPPNFRLGNVVKSMAAGEAAGEAAGGMHAIPQVPLSTARAPSPRDPCLASRSGALSSTLESGRKRTRLANGAEAAMNHPNSSPPSRVTVPHSRPVFEPTPDGAQRRKLRDLKAERAEREKSNQRLPDISRDDPRRSGDFERFDTVRSSGDPTRRASWDSSKKQPLRLDDQADTIPMDFISGPMSVPEWRELRKTVFGQGDDVDQLAFKLLQEIILSPVLGIRFDALKPFSDALLKSVGKQYFKYDTGAYVRLSDFPSSLRFRQVGFGDPEWLKEKSPEEVAVCLVMDNILYSFDATEDSEEAKQQDLSVLPSRGLFGLHNGATSRAVMRDGGRAPRYEDAVNQDPLFTKLYNYLAQKHMQQQHS